MTDATRRHWLTLLGASVVPAAAGTMEADHNPAYDMKQFERVVSR